MNDGELLREFSERGREESFHAVVQRHMALVHGVAWRRTGDRAIAEEVAQSAFTALARKAARLAGRESVAGWLYRTAVTEAADAMRREYAHRRKLDHLEKNGDATAPGDDAWGEAMPLLDEAIDALPRTDREVILRHFFQRQGFREIGGALGKTENAVQKQAARALEKLGTRLRSRGVALSLAALVAGLGVQLAHAAPAGLAQVVSHVALAGGSSATAKIFLLETIRTFMTTKAKATLAATAAVALTAALTFTRAPKNAPQADEDAALKKSAVAQNDTAGSGNAGRSRTAARAVGLDNSETASARGAKEPESVASEWEHALLNNDTLRRAQQIAALCAGITAQNAPAVARAFGRAEKRGLKFTDEERLFLRAWGQADGRAAVAHVEQRQGCDSAEAVAALGGWASAAPAAARAWVDTVPEWDGKDNLVFGLIDGWATADFRSASAYLATRPQSAEREEFSRLLLQRALRSGGTAAAQQWVDSIPETGGTAGYKRTAFGEVVQTVLQSDPDAAVRMISDANGKSYVGLGAVAPTAMKLAQTSPSGALNWIASLDAARENASGTSLVAAGAGQIMGNWARTDATAAGTWLAQNTTHPGYEQMAASYAKAVRSTDSAAAAQWAQTISRDALRDDALNGPATKPVSANSAAQNSRAATANTFLGQTQCPARIPTDPATMWSNCTKCHH